MSFNRFSGFIFRCMFLVIILFTLLCVGLYFLQEKLIYFPQRLDKAYRFDFRSSFEEINIPTEEGVLNGVLFRADSAKGLIFYLHGNGGSVGDWGSVADRYTALRYDVFILDYPGYGKSDGAISSQAKLYKAVQSAYDKMKSRYKEEEIVVLGYSIGTGPAAWLAAGNRPGKLILQAPYYSLTDIMRKTWPFVPTFLLKYKFPTNEYLAACKMPVVIIHGDQDEVIYYGSSLKLQKEMKAGDTLITLHGQTHNGITDNPDYVALLPTILR
ncbi:alpha/beta hydrolase [Flavihumibacter petaseus]|uniref:AB hydrolase-1 domain-containing protein n=1 Tax=Flavihumibacter petaseus NBRC 106054 TaxID=1220578 RepID=A0A0E9MUI6_9BACT|nr:alpha/beta fold hydrolase [Flavihumibacter petaseus]GAO41402.1 hypothetical protein FPE01S_01_04140 [Flavihumibacter petaseus NBRC 106054]